MYITNNPDIAQIAEKAGVDWIFLDMEFIGKGSRQGGLDTVQNHHTHENISIVKGVLTTSSVLVRVNPMHSELPDYMSSEKEIEKAIESGADIIMLPFFKTTDEVHKFIQIVESSCKRYGRNVKTCLLLETPESADLLEQLVEIPGINMIHIGLNDMHLALGRKFMFQLLADGSVDKWASIIKSKGIKYGFGGLASLDGGAVPGSMILKEHYRLGSQQVILSRAFCNTDIVTDLEEVKKIFDKGINEIRKLEQDLLNADSRIFEENRLAVVNAVNAVIESK